MKPKIYDRLTWSVVQTYGDRKQPGRVSVFVDVPTSEVYPVPRDVEHKDFICDILHETPGTVAQHAQIAGFVPVHIDLDAANERVLSVITGLSGFEEVYGVRHARKHLDLAHARALEFVRRGEVPADESLEERAHVDSRYVLR